MSDVFPSETDVKDLISLLPGHFNLLRNVFDWLSLKDVSTILITSKTYQAAIIQLFRCDEIFLKQYLSPNTRLPVLNKTPFNLYGPLFARIPQLNDEWTDV